MTARVWRPNVRVVTWTQCFIGSRDLRVGSNAQASGRILSGVVAILRLEMVGVEHSVCHHLARALFQIVSQKERQLLENHIQLSELQILLTRRWRSGTLGGILTAARLGSGEKERLELTRCGLGPAHMLGMIGRAFWVVMLFSFTSPG